MMRRNVTMIGLVACTLLAAGVAGCSNRRPLHILQQDAEYAARRGEWEKAQADYGEFLVRRPDRPDIRYQYAMASAKAGNTREAIENLRICLDVDPLNDQYIDGMAEVMYQANERDQLIQILARNASERGRVNDYLRLGKYSALIGNADEAQVSLLTAAKLDGGTNPAVQVALADFYKSVGDTQRQIRRLRMAYYLNPKDESVIAAIREAGEVPGPTFGIPPEELPR